jgi:hypothetical protein
LGIEACFALRSGDKTNGNTSAAVYIIVYRMIMVVNRFEVCVCGDGGAFGRHVVVKIGRCRYHYRELRLSFPVAAGTHAGHCVKGPCTPSDARIYVFRKLLTNKMPPPRTPIKPKRREYSTICRARFVDAYFKKQKCTSLGQICRRNGIEIPTSTA